MNMSSFFGVIWYMRYEEKNKKGRTINSFIFEMFSFLLSAFIVFIFIFTFAFRLVTVDGSSMNNTLLNEDRLIVSELFSEPKCGDIIVANAEKSIGKIIIKRVIATEGQMLKIDYDNNQITVDGVIIDEPYLSVTTTKPTDYWEIPSVIPKGYVFVMGDNRPGSLDSRDSRVQLIPVEDIVGKAEFIVFPPNRITYLY